MKAILYDWGGLNVWLFHQINAVHAPWLDWLMQLGTRLGDHANFPLYLSLTALFAVVVAGRNRLNRDAGMQTGLTVLAVLSISYLLDGQLLSWIKPVLDFPRPLLALPPGSVIVVGQPEYHHSLPSGHSSFAMLICASLWPLLDRQGRLTASVFVCWVGLSRISLGAHFPADVLAGFTSSLLIVLAVRYGINQLATSRRNQPP